MIVSIENHFLEEVFDGQKYGTSWIILDLVELISKYTGCYDSKNISKASKALEITFLDFTKFFFK